jgi:hypothetical protein
MSTSDILSSIHLTSSSTCCNRRRELALFCWYSERNLQAVPICWLASRKVQNLEGSFWKVLVTWWHLYLRITPAYCWIQWKGFRWKARVRVLWRHYLKHLKWVLINERSKGMDSQVQIDKVQVEQLLKTEETRPMPGNEAITWPLIIGRSWKGSRWYAWWGWDIQE